ncbi:MAG: ABC transporter substrate-binding protein [Clostridiales bacterium]|nr:ABC transporter substrate-binding protein [Clostridiales bacterium]
MKKLISTITTAVIALSALTACNAVPQEDNVKVRIGSLSGPTTIGIINLMDDVNNGTVDADYEFTVATQPDEIAAALNAGDLDIALIPANLAAVLYNRTEGGIRVIDINTYGVLYCITSDTSITSVSDLSGKTVITTGQGATPEYAMNYLLEQYGVTDCTLDFKTEGAEVVAALGQDPSLIAVLPQPAATAAMVQNPDLQIAFSLDDAWNEVTSDSRLVTGVTVARTEFIEAHPNAIASFEVYHHNSVIEIENNLDATAQLVVDQGIVGALPVAQRAIPLCNIDSVNGAQMRSELESYLQTLYDANPESVGGAMPGEDFYYTGS